MRDADRQLVLRPLLGFGWAGWVLLAIAILLSIFWAMGVDLRYQLLFVVHRVAGDHATYWLVSKVLTWHYVEVVAVFPPDPDFGLVTLCLILVAIHIHPRRRRWWTYAALVAWAIVAPSLVVLVYDVRKALWGQHDIAIMTPSMARIVISAALVAQITRWWPIPLMMGVIGTCCLFNESAASQRLGWGTSVPLPEWMGDMMLSALIRWPYYPALIGLLLWWAIRARLAVPGEGHCDCGYDMIGLTGPTCPECGTPWPTPPETSPSTG